MPRVSVNRKKYKKTDFSKWLLSRMYAEGINQAEMGRMLGISQQAFSQRVKGSKFSYEEMLTIFEKLKATDDEILKLMKVS